MLIGLFRIHRLAERQSDAEQLECVSTEEREREKEKKRELAKVNESLSLSAAINAGLLLCTEHRCFKTSAQGRVQA